MTIAELLATFERRAQEAERIGATAPVAAVLRDVAAELAPLVDGNGAPDSRTGDDLARARHGTPPAASTDQLLTAKQVAERLGCSTRYVYAHASSWPFTVRLDGRAVRFDPEGLARWTRRVG